MFLVQARAGGQWLIAVVDMHVMARQQIDKTLGTPRKFGHTAVHDEIDGIIVQDGSILVD